MCMHEKEPKLFKGYWGSGCTLCAVRPAHPAMNCCSCGAAASAEISWTSEKCCCYYVPWDAAGLLLHCTRKRRYGHIGQLDTGSGLLGVWEKCELCCHDQAMLPAFRRGQQALFLSSRGDGAVQSQELHWPVQRIWSTARVSPSLTDLPISTDIVSSSSVAHRLTPVSWDKIFLYLYLSCIIQGVCWSNNKCLSHNSK